MKIRMQQYQDIESFKIDLLTFWNDYVRSESDNLKLQQSTALFGAAIQRLDSVTQTSSLSLQAMASQPKSLSVLLGAATTSLLQFSKGKDAVHYHLNCVEAGAIRHAEAIAAARRHLGGSFVYSSPAPVSGPSSIQGSCSDTLLSESLDREAAPGAASYQTPSASSAAVAAAAVVVAEKPQKPRPRSSRRAVVAGAVSASVSVSGGGIEASGTAVAAPAAVATPNVVVVSSSSSQTLVEANSVQKRH